MKHVANIMRHGADAHGNIAHIDDVERGASCGLSCMSCGRPLVARKGEKNVHSFSHQAEISDKEIRKCHESYAHFFAKNSLVNQGFVYLPECLDRWVINEYYINGINRNLSPNYLSGMPSEPFESLRGFEKVRFDVIGWDVEPFDINNRIRPDAKLKCSRNSIDFHLNVEIVYSHKVDSEKYRKIVDGKINCIEINISSVDFTDLERSILKGINDIENISVINFDDDLSKCFLPPLNLNTLSYFRAIDEYTKLCMEMTAKSGVRLPIDLIHPTFFTNHKGESIYHNNHSGSGDLYKCKGGGNGLLIFENDLGNEVSVSFRREENSKADLVCKKTHSWRRSIGFPDFFSLSGRMRAGHKHNIAEKGAEVREWVLSSAFRELDAYCSALLIKLNALDITQDGVEVKRISLTKATAEINVNFFNYYGEGLVLEFLTGLDISHVLNRRHGSVVSCFESSNKFEEKYVRAVKLIHHIDRSFYNIRKNFDILGCDLDRDHKFFSIKSLVLGLMPSIVKIHPLWQPMTKQPTSDAEKIFQGVRGLTSDAAKILQRVRGIAEKNRKIIEEIRQKSLSQNEKTGACFNASILSCAQTINKFTAANAIIRGGDGEGNGGLLVDGVRNGHCWLEVGVCNDRFIVDITADQFGLPPIIIERVEVMQQLYVPGDQQVVDGHVADMKNQLGIGVDQ